MKQPLLWRYYNIHNTRNPSVLIKSISLFVLVLLLTAGLPVPSTVTQTSLSTEAVIPWSPDRKLCWDDFRGQPRAHGFTGAATHARIKVTPRANSYTGRVKVQVKALFECHKSWALEKAKDSDYLLNHEQRHFDIAELFAQKLRRELAGIRITARNYPRVKREVIQRIFQEYVDYDESYDRQTVHGIDQDAQAEWDQRIDRRLRPGIPSWNR